MALASIWWLLGRVCTEVCDCLHGLILTLSLVEQLIGFLLRGLEHLTRAARRGVVYPIRFEYALSRGPLPKKEYCELWRESGVAHSTDHHT